MATAGRSLATRAKTAPQAAVASSPALKDPKKAQTKQAGAYVLPGAPASIPVHAFGEDASASRRGPASLPLLPLQRKLAIGSTNDSLEAEADAAAKAILGPESGGPARRLRRVDVALAEAPPLVHQVLRAPGQELDSETRSWAETVYQRDFRRVRIHAGELAEASAASINARAYTVGSRIVFGSGAVSGGVNDRTVMAHELAHVVQQGTAPALAQPAPGQTPMAPVRGATAPMVQRQEAEPQATGSKDLGWITEGIVEVASLPARALGDTAFDLAHATWHGFFAEIKEHGGEAASNVLGRLREFVTSPKELALFFPKYWWGLIKGVFSPVTGLFDLAKLAVQLAEIGGHAATTAWENREKIVADANGLAASMRGLGGKAINALKGLFSNPVETATGLLGLLDQAKSEANGAAERGGHKIAGMLLAATNQPIPDLAETAGEAIGTVVVNVALFVFTEGIGDAIVQIAGKLGEVGAWLGRFGKAAEMLGALVAKLGELLTTVGGWVTKGEALIGKLAGALLKPLEPVLEEFGELVSQLRTFLRDLLGVAENAEAQEAAAAAKALAGATKEPHAPRLSGGEPPPPPRPKLEPQTPHPTEPRTPAKTPAAKKPPPPPPKKAPPVERPSTPPVQPDQAVPAPPPQQAPPVEKPAVTSPNADTTLGGEGGPAKKPETQPVQGQGESADQSPKPKTEPDADQPGENEPDTQQPAPEEKKPPESDKTQTEEPPVDKAKRLQEIKNELAANDTEIKKLDRQINDASDRATEAGNKEASARGDERERWQKNKRRNAATRDRLQSDRAKLARRNRELYDEQRRLVRPPDPESWQKAEDYLRDEFKGQKKSIEVNDQLGERDIDCYTPDGIAREVKHGGPFDITDRRIQLELDKDIALLKAKKVTAVEWHFYKNPATGGAGPTARLEKALTDAGIKVVRDY